VTGRDGLHQHQRAFGAQRQARAHVDVPSRAPLGRIEWSTGTQQGAPGHVTHGCGLPAGMPDNPAGPAHGGRQASALAHWHRLATLPFDRSDRAGHYFMRSRVQPVVGHGHMANREQTVTAVRRTACWHDGDRPCWRVIAAGWRVIAAMGLAGFGRCRARSAAHDRRGRQPALEVLGVGDWGAGQQPGPRCGGDLRGGAGSCQGERNALGERGELRSEGLEGVWHGGGQDD
jgi:hypothetical protein